MAPRRSARHKPLDDSETVASTPLPDSDCDELTPRETTKRRKRTKAKVDVTAEDDAVTVETRRRRRGILQKMNDTPLDVLFEIFSYLQPLDLLRISRTTKDLRGLLMSKSSAFVWESARLGMDGLPPMIKDLNEPQYANLLFDSHCHGCGNAPTKHVQWEIRMRLCLACLDSGSIMSNSQTLAHHIRVLTPSYTNYSHTSKSYYHLATYNRIRDEYYTIFQTSPDSEHRAKWMKSKQVEKDRLYREAIPYNKWMQTKQVERTDELSALREARLKGIKERLFVEGWSKDLKDAAVWAQLQTHKLVKEPKALTDRIWLNLRPKLAELIKEIKAAILKEKIDTAIERRSAMVSRISYTPWHSIQDVVKPPRELMPQLPAFASIINDTPLHEDVSHKDFAPLLENLPRIFADWRAVQEEYLTNLLGGAAGKHKHKHKHVLSLMSSIFKCTKCKERCMRYPDILSHRCVFDEQRGQWNIRCIQPALKTTHAWAKSLVQESGLDFATATSKDMDDVNAYFRCSKCKSYSLPPGKEDAEYWFVMNWRTAYDHLSNCGHAGGPKLSRVTDTVIVAEAIEKDELSGAQEPRVRSCIHCRAKNAVNDPDKGSAHLRDIHGIVAKDCAAHYDIYWTMHWRDGIHAIEIIEDPTV